MRAPRGRPGGTRVGARPAPHPSRKQRDRYACFFGIGSLSRTSTSVSLSSSSESDGSSAMVASSAMSAGGFAACVGRTGCLRNAEDACERPAATRARPARARRELRGRMTGHRRVRDLRRQGGTRRARCGGRSGAPRSTRDVARRRRNPQRGDGGRRHGEAARVPVTAGEPRWARRARGARRRRAPAPERPPKEHLRCGRSRWRSTPPAGPPPVGRVPHRPGRRHPAPRAGTARTWAAARARGTRRRGVPPAAPPASEASGAAPERRRRRDIAGDGGCARARHPPQPHHSRGGRRLR